MNKSKNIPQSQAESLYSGFIKTLIDQKVADVALFITQILNKKNNMDIKDKIEQINRLKNWLDSFRPLSREVIAELKKHYDVKFTYNSNAIEGNTLTQSETEMVLEKGITVGGKQLHEHLEAVGHKKAIDYIESLAKKDIVITEREVKDIHHLIMRSIRVEDAGRYRNLDVRAAGTEHIYPAHFLVQELMEKFLVWMGSEEAKLLHPIELATEVHYRFVSIHPFNDGNGRTARLLMNLALLRQGFPIAVIDNKKRVEYIESLVYAQDNEDQVDKLLIMVLDCCEESLVDYLRVASTALASKGKGEAFYTEVAEFLKNT